jgi:hypothetical protein
MTLLLSFVVLFLCFVVNRKRSRDHDRILESLRDFDRGESGKGIEQSCINWKVMRERL